MAFVLPVFNGMAEVGIAAGADAGLPDNRRLSVGTAVELPNARYSHLCASASEIARAMVGARPELRDLIIACAQASAVWGLLSPDDGDIIQQVHPAPDAASIGQINGITDEMRLRALTLIVSTKVSWWQTNHHTGGSHQRAAGYIAKVLNTTFRQLSPGEPSIDQDVVAVAHMVGHWASTRLVIKKLFIGCPVPYPSPAEIDLMDAIDTDYDDFVTNAAHAGTAVAPTATCAGLGGQAIRCANDAQLRAMGAPAGSARTSVVVAACRMLFSHPLVLFCPDLVALVNFYQHAEARMRDKRRCHIGSLYLTGLPKLFDDNLADAHIGVVGTFVRRVMPKSTLAKSPHFSDDRVFNALDYAVSWDQLCYQAAGAMAYGGNARVAARAAMGAGNGGVVAMASYNLARGAVNMPILDQATFDALEADIANAVANAGPAAPGVVQPAGAPIPFAPPLAGAPPGVIPMVPPGGAAAAPGAAAAVAPGGMP